jgi:5'-nucleotidase
LTRPSLPIQPRHLLPGLAAFVAAVLVALLGLRASAEHPAVPPAPEGPLEGRVTLRLLGVNDFHGHLEPPQPGVGGAAWLKAHLDAAELPGRTIRVHAGDMVGATPLLSSWFHDEPSIETANEIGFDVGTLGNHEFDKGGEELLRLLHGGRRQGPEALKRDLDGSLVDTSSPDFAGARFPYVAANTLDRDGTLLLPPFQIVERAGARVGFIGVTTTSTPTFVLPRFADRFRFTDISDAVNRWVPELQRRGVDAIVVLAHEGAPTQAGDDSPRATGTIVDEARQMSDAVDVVIAGHSHSRLDLRIPNASGRGDKLIVEALSYGVAYDRVDLTIDRGLGRVVSKRSAVPETRHAGIAADPTVAALVERYRRRVAPLADHVLGSAPQQLTRANGQLAQLAADAQRAFADADVALVNPGSLRGDVDAGPIPYAELFAAQAYDHRLLRFELSGAELEAALAGLGDGVAVAGETSSLDPERRYAVVANELFATGGAFPAAAIAAARPVGSEVQATARYVEHGFTSLSQTGNRPVTAGTRRVAKVR